MQLKAELSSFSPEFFEEVEDLKFREKQGRERVQLLTQRLQQLSRQYGFSLPEFTSAKT